MKIEIEARFLWEKRRFGECLIGQADVCNGSVAIAREAGAGSRITIKGDANECELSPGMTYRFYGRWTDYFNKWEKRKERQFTFDTFVQAIDHSEEGIVAYLAGAGEGLGVGPATAKKAWDRWGTDCIRKIRENPQILLEVNRRLDEDQLLQLQSKLVSMQKTEDATIELTNLLHGRGFPKKLPRKLIEKWGNKAAEFVSKDPYCLMQFRNCGFKLTDSLYIELGLPKDRLRRQALCGWYSIASDNTGDVWFPIAKAESAIRSSIGRNADPARAIELGRRLASLSPDHYGALAVCSTNGDALLSPTGTRKWIAEGKNAGQEDRLARLVVSAIEEAKPAALSQFTEKEIVKLEPRDHCRCWRCSRQLTAPTVHVLNGVPYGPTCIGYINGGDQAEIVALDEWMQRNPIAHKQVKEFIAKRIQLPWFSLWPDPSEIRQVTDHQREQYALATTGRIGIISGSPGTGKTHLIAQIVRALIAGGRVGIDDIAVCAPTGKAAVRITESLLAAKLPIRAKTCHSLLGVGESDVGEGWRFKHNEQNPWSYRVIILDEGSMPDLMIAASVFAARPRGAHVLLVGDINQLPPVGCGAPLRDLIAAGLPYGELREIWRNSGGIVEACAAIRDNKSWGPGDNLHIVAPGSPELQLEAAESIIDKCRASGFDPVWDCQIICAVNKTSPLSRKAINEKFQGILNPPTKVSKDKFRVNDKVVCLKNGWFGVADPSYLDSIDPELLNEKGELYVANGQLAKVLEVEEKLMIVELAGQQIPVRVPRGGKQEKDDSDEESESTGCSFDLAYALSCHKFQGSECPVVIVMIDEHAGAKRVCTREWVYTAISRGKMQVWLVGKKSTVDAFCKRQALPKRKTFLREKIGLLQADRVLETVL